MDALTFLETKEQMALRRRAQWPFFRRALRFSLVFGCALFGAAAAFFFWLDPSLNRYVQAALLSTLAMPTLISLHLLSFVLPVRVTFGERAFSSSSGKRIAWNKVKRFEFLRDPAVPGYCGAALHGANGILAVAWVPESAEPHVARFMRSHIVP